MHLPRRLNARYDDLLLVRLWTRGVGGAALYRAVMMLIAISVVVRIIMIRKIFVERILSLERANRVENGWRRGRGDASTFFP